MRWLSMLLSGWKWVLGAFAGAAVLFYRWRSQVNKAKADRAKDRVTYLETKQDMQKDMARTQEAVKKRHKREREKLQERRRRGERGGGLGDW